MEKIRADFPILRQKIRGKPLVYLDNAATSQKPQVVINAITRYYERDNANIHRGVHFLSEHATEEHDEARATIQHSSMPRIPRKSSSFAAPPKPSTLSRKPTAARTSARATKSSSPPWSTTPTSFRGRFFARKRARSSASRRSTIAASLLLDEFANLLGPKTKLVAVTHVSNALGSIIPIRRMIELAHAQNIPVLVDGAQAVPHMKVDVQALDCDFYAFSGHKVYGPTGIGVLYGKAALLEAMPPYQGGGDMISFGHLRENAVQQAALQI